MPNKRDFAVETTGSKVTGTLMDKLPVDPNTPPAGLTAIGPRVTFHFITEPWSADNEYQYYDVVNVNDNSYIAIKNVPSGTQITDTEYWFHWADPNAQYQELLNTVNSFDQRISDNTDDISYISSVVLNKYKTVNDMINDTDLEENDNALTLGFHTEGIGGTLYTIKTNQIPNGMDIIQLKNQMYAVKVATGIIYPDEYGAKADGTTDDSDILQHCFDIGECHINRNYTLTKTLNAQNSIICENDSYIDVIDNVDTALTLANDTQAIARVFDIRINANAKADTAIKVGIVKNSVIKLRVENAGTTGVETNIASTGNNENIFMINVAGNEKGTTETGILLNSADSIYLELITQDCQTGVSIKVSNAYIYQIHSWLSEKMKTMWDGSVVVNLGAYICNIGWLYQDSVQTGIYGAGLCHVDYFQYNNTHTEPETDYVNLKSDTACKTTINTYINNKNESEYFKYSVSALNVSRFGAIVNSIALNNNPVNNSFSDLNNAPSVGTFYIPYTFTNGPQSTNGVLECKVIGNMYKQIFTSVSNGSIWQRFMLYNNTWTDWKQIANFA